tara:strand:- start:2429 stop:4540 length:2112 start_codon:yes stop_codon:yes gene_type:complete
MKLLDYQLQSNVARLLSRENITVTHANVPTACFDLRNRVMKLPLWKDFGKVVYDMLIAHEVGHAIFDDYPLVEKYLSDNNIKGIPDVLNVIDDIRIERLVQDKYPGLPKIFLAAYRTLVDADLFKIKGRDISKMKFLDRLNLHAKIGTIVPVPLNEEELDFYNRCYVAETTQEVIDLFEEFQNRPKEDEEPQSPEGELEQSSDDESEEGEEESSSNPEAGDESGESEEGDADESGESDEKSGDGDTTSTTTKDAPENSEKSETQEEFEKNLSENFDNRGWEDPRPSDFVPVIFPRKSTVNKITNSYKDVMKSREESSTWPHRPSDFNGRYIDYKKNMKKKVGVLIREFERRKAAFRYSRSSESRVGTIDVNNLHKYRYDDQIFNTVTQLADGKNHGMIFYVDYSGSMTNVLADVIDQTLHLVYFCKKIGIPFEVYSYTTTCNWDHPKISDPNEISLDSLVLNNIMSSSMSKSDFELGFQQLFFQTGGHGYYNIHGLSNMEQLGGTPLNAVIMVANHHCNDFQKKHRVDKLNVILLTDGDSERAQAREANNGITTFEGKKIDISARRRYIGGESSSSHYTRSDSQQEALLNLLRKKATVIGMYLPSSLNDAKRKLSLSEKSADKLRKVYTKTKFTNLPNVAGYDALMILPYNIKIIDNDFEFSTEEDISESRSAQSKLAKQFAKNNSENKRSRVILSKFAELIA